MPVTVGVSLEEDGVRGVLQGISGDGKGLGEVWEVEDGTRQEELLEFIKGLLTSGSPIPTIVFLGEVKEGAGDSRVVRYKPTVEIGKAQEGSYVLNFGRGWPSGDTVTLD